MPVLREDVRTSKAGLWTRGAFTSVQVNVGYLGDTPVNLIGDAANEPSIAVDPTLPNRMAIGWRQFDTIESNFRQAGWGHSSDGGRSWRFPGVIQPGIFRSDPVLDADLEGRFYYNSLSVPGGVFTCHVFRSDEGGASWGDAVYAFGGDKQWMTIDRTTGPGVGNIYACWNRDVSCCEGQFTVSYDAGATFTYLIDVPGSPFWGTLAVGPDSELYVSGNGFVVSKSTTIHDPLASPKFDFTTTVYLDGNMQIGGGPNPVGLLGQVWVATDTSDGPYGGNVYLACSVARYSTTDPLDVMFSSSSDGGVTWSPPVRVNDDAEDSGAFQWFATMSVAPNGRIDMIWNDTRADPFENMRSELYYSSSDDGGVTWSDNIPVSPSFDPRLGWPSQNKLGDYYDMVSDRVGAHVAYAATFNGEQDVYYLRIGDYDCNDNGIGDTVDLADATSTDCNSNDIPDECEAPFWGDYDADGSVDFGDLAALIDCLAGPGSLPQPASPECAPYCLQVFDTDGDDDVDLHDYADIL